MMKEVGWPVTQFQADKAITVRTEKHENSAHSGSPETRGFILSFFLGYGVAKADIQATGTARSTRLRSLYRDLKVQTPTKTVMTADVKIKMEIRMILGHF